MSISCSGITRAELHNVKPLTVTVAMAREISGLGATTIWALIKSGKLESVRVCRRRLIVYQSLERLLSPASPDASTQPRRRGRPPKRQWGERGQKHGNQAASQKDPAGVVS